MGEDRRAKPDTNTGLVPQLFCHCDVFACAGGGAGSAKASASAWLTSRMVGTDRAPRYSPSSSLPSVSMLSALAKPTSGSLADKATQVGSRRAVVVSRMASTSAVWRLRGLLETISQG